MKCDIIIPVWNQPEVTGACVEHITRNTRYPYRLILIDNASERTAKEYLEGLSAASGGKIRLIRNEENLGYVKAVNQGLRISSAPYVCMMNNDTLPGEGWLSELVEFFGKHPEAGLLNPASGGHLVSGAGVNEYARKLAGANKGKFMEMNQCQGWCMLVKRDVIEKIGYLDERFGLGGFDDTDYSMRAHLAGYKSVCVHSSYVYHKMHTSFDRMGDRKKIQADSEREYFKKWPRHLRVAIMCSAGRAGEDEKNENILKTALFLARKWCWVNLFMFGDRKTAAGIEKTMKRMDFPIHQNIKYNYPGRTFKVPEILIRMLERSFGTKRRKRYDVVICDTAFIAGFLGRVSKITGANASHMGFSSYDEKKLLGMIAPFRKGFTAEKNNKCDIILPVCDEYEFTRNCVDSIIRNTDTPFRLIIINNGKHPKTGRLLDELEKREDVETTVVRNARNIGWVKALNKGIELSNAPFICFQNDDTVVTAGWLRKMTDTLNRDERFGIINPSWEGRPRAVSIDKYNEMLERKGKRFVETDWARGFSAVIKRSVVETIGKVDEIYGLAYFDDVDYSVTAIDRGFLVLKALDTYVYHHRNVTFFQVLKGGRWNALHEKNKLIYYKKWGKPLRIVLILGGDAFREVRLLDEIEKTVFYLARKQHRVEIWSPRRMPEGRFEHTNARVKVFPGPALGLYAKLGLYLNSKKKASKRYDAVFDYRLKKEFTRGDFDEFVKNKVDTLKEKTKDEIDVKL